MKKYTLALLTVILFYTSLFAQEKRHELKTNLTNTILIQWLDVGYEYILNEESSIGISGLISFSSDRGTGNTFSLTPYYRHFFSEKYARGFFLDGFSMLHSSKYDWLTFFSGNNFEDQIDLALGTSIGWKFMSKQGLVSEIAFGIGRDITNNDLDTDIVTRGGLSFGFRF